MTVKPRTPLPSIGQMKSKLLVLLPQDEKDEIMKVAREELKVSAAELMRHAVRVFIKELHKKK